MNIKHLFIALIAAAFLSSAIDTKDALKEGGKAPEITYNDGSKENLKDGKLRLINLWSPKDPLSRIENKELNDLVSRESLQNVEFISICTDSDDLLAKEVIAYDDLKSGTHILFSEISERSLKDYMAEGDSKILLIGSDGLILKTDEDVREYLLSI